MLRIASRSACVASGGSISETGAPPKLKSENAMKPTTSITTTPCTSLLRTKAIKLSPRTSPRRQWSGVQSLDLPPLDRELVGRPVHHAHVRTHHPGDHLEMKRQVADVVLVDAARVEG